MNQNENRSGLPMADSRLDQMGGAEMTSVAMKNLVGEAVGRMDQDRLVP